MRSQIFAIRIICQLEVNAHNQHRRAVPLAARNTEPRVMLQKATERHPAARQHPPDVIFSIALLGVAAIIVVIFLAIQLALW